jgi:iron complex transport system permease protein
LHILVGEVFDTPATWTASQHAVVTVLRLPRIAAALLVGAALASSGAAYQTMLRNPLVAPEILGVASGAAFGGALSLLIGLSYTEQQIVTFVFGLLAALLALAIGRLAGSVSPIVIVLGGIVVGSLFAALVGATEFFANPETTLPAIVFWLFGSLDRVTPENLPTPAAIVGVCLVGLYLVRWPLTVLATGEDEARALGVNRRIVWTVVIAASTLMTATVVSVAGVVGWVGLVIPHIARSLVGPTFSRLLVASALIGGGFLLGVDDVARSATSMELPLGILTALIGAPFFVVLLVRAAREWV